MSEEEKKERVVIVGGGFAGLKAARSLAGKAGVHVTLIDRRNHHLFQPLLYQVALAALSPADIAVPIRSIVSGHDNVDVLLGNVREVDLKNKAVQTGFGTIPYDRLVLACGANHSYFGNDHWEDSAPGLKSLEEATEIRRRVLLAFELAERTADPEVQRRFLTFIIIGAGPTGVELAGAIAEISRNTLSRDFQHIDPRNTRVYLLEGGPRVLPAFDPKLSESAKTALEKLGVIVRTNTMASDVSANGVRVGDEALPAYTVLWAAGVRPSSLNAKMSVEVDRQGRVIVNEDLSLPDYPDVFVLGDQSNFSHTKDGDPLPGLAPVAIQMGDHVAKNILRDIKGKERKPFRYRGKGMMATIGRAHAVVQAGKLKFGGLFAWLAWLFVHIAYLIGFRNRVMVLFQWFWSYMTFARGARLVTSRNWKSEKRFDLANRYTDSIFTQQDPNWGKDAGGSRKKLSKKASSKKKKSQPAKKKKSKRT